MTKRKTSADFLKEIDAVEAEVKEDLGDDTNQDVEDYFTGLRAKALLISTLEDLEKLGLVSRKGG